MIPGGSQVPVAVAQLLDVRPLLAMDAQQTAKFHYIRAAVVFIACLPIVFVLPVIDGLIHSVLPTWWVNFLFFAPQLFFPYRAFAVDHGSDYMFSWPVAVLLAILEWGLVTLLFSWLAKRVRFRYLIPLAIFTVLFVCVAMFALFIPLLSSLGVDIQFDSL